jgi:hypothetical protein
MIHEVLLTTTLVTAASEALLARAGPVHRVNVGR